VNARPRSARSHGSCRVPARRLPRLLPPGVIVGRDRGGEGSAAPHRPPRSTGAWAPVAPAASARAWPGTRRGAARSTGPADGSRRVTSAWRETCPPPRIPGLLRALTARRVRGAGRRVRRRIGSWHRGTAGSRGSASRCCGGDRPRRGAAGSRGPVPGVTWSPRHVTPWLTCTSRGVCAGRSPPRASRRTRAALAQARGASSRVWPRPPQASAPRGSRKPASARRRSTGIRTTWDPRGLATPPGGPPVRLGRHRPSALTPARRRARPRWRTRPSRRSAAIRALRGSGALGSPPGRRLASTRPTGPAFSSRPTGRLASWGERPGRYPPARSRHVGSTSGSLRWTSACWPTRSHPLGRPSVRTPPADVGISTRCTGCGGDGPARRVPCRRSRADAWRASHGALVPASRPAPPRGCGTFAPASAQVCRRHPWSRRAWPCGGPGLPAAAGGGGGAPVASGPAWGRAPRALSHRPGPPPRVPHVARAPHRPGPAPAARPCASGGAAAPGRGPRPFAVAAGLRRLPRADAWHRVGPHGARAALRADRAGASGRGVWSPWPARASAGVTRGRPSRPCGRDQVARGHPRLFPPGSSAHPVVRWGGTLRLRLQRAGSTMPPRGPTGSSWGGLPALTPRGCSARPADPTARWAPCPPAACERRASGPPWRWPAVAVVPG